MDDDDNISMLECLNRFFENELETEENDKENKENEKEKRQRQPDDKEKEQRVKEEKGWFNILYLSLTLLIQKL